MSANLGKIREILSIFALEIETLSKMKLILMTTPTFFVEEHQILTALFDEGLDLSH